MAVFNEPTKWAQSLGATANADVIPDEAGAMDVDISKIFPAVFSVPLSQGGKAIPRRTLNGILKLLGDWIYYIQNGGIASYSASFDYAVGRVVLYTDGNLYKCIQANGATDPKTPTDSAYWLRITTTADSPTGEIKIWTSSTIPDGFLLCNGAAVSRETYANLFSVIGTTYGAGDGSTTFNIPDLRDRYIIGANTNALGTKVAEQLPNITGDFHCWGKNEPNLETGMFFQNYTTPNYDFHTSSSAGYEAYIGIASSLNRGSSIYTDNGKVYPASLALSFIIKA